MTEIPYSNIQAIVEQKLGKSKVTENRNGKEITKSGIKETKIKYRIWKNKSVRKYLKREIYGKAES